MKVSWQDLYQSALLELDPNQLWLRIEEARTAVRQRMAEMRQNGFGTQEESASLEAAMRVLRVLAEKECKFQSLGRSGPVPNEEPL
jgi:hypothetical protein